MRGDGPPVPTPAERQAFLYLALVTAVGTAVRAWDGRASGPNPSEAQTLAAQLAAVDSALAQRAGPAINAGRRPRRAAGPAVTGGVASAPRLVSPPPAPPSSAGPIDVDRADAATLERLPGIGPALAARIVADRDARGPFGSPVGLERVRGIGPAMMRRFGGLVTFSGVPRPADAVRPSATGQRSP